MDIQVVVLCRYSDGSSNVDTNVAQVITLRSARTKSPSFDDNPLEVLNSFSRVLN